jgi:hypothetical protein
MDLINSLRFPVLLFGQDNSLEILSTLLQLTTTNKLGLKHGIVLNNLIVDCNGNFFKTVCATKLKNLNSFWKFEFFNPMIRINLELKEQQPIDLNSLKNKVKKAITKEFHFWNFDTKEEAGLNIDRTTSIEELILLLSRKR